MLEIKNSSSRIIIDPVEDTLLRAGIKYLDMLDKADDVTKGRQFGLFLELLETTIESGDSFDWPNQEQLPTNTLVFHDDVTEGQSVKLVGKIVKQLIARRNARY